MYRVKDEKRVRQSAERLVEGLEKCLSKKPLSRISVSDICSSVNVSRGTFYRLFDTPTDVAEYACDTLVAESVREVKALNVTTRDEYTLFMVEFWLKHSDFLGALHATNRIDLFQKAIAKNADFMAPTAPKFHLDQDEIDYHKATVTAMFCSILEVWMLHGKRESAQDILNIFKKFTRL